MGRPKKPPAPEPAKKRGRPSKRTPDLCTEICERLSKGEPMARICRDAHMPDPSTVWEWTEVNADFSQAIARARMRGFDAIAEETLDIADDARNDFIQKLADEGDGSASAAVTFNSEHVQRSKLRIETRLKLLAKWDPKRFGDRLELAGGLEVKKGVSDLTDEELMAIAARKSDKTGAKS